VTDAPLRSFKTYSLILSTSEFFGQRMAILEYLEISSGESLSPKISLTSFLPMLLKKHMVTDPIVFQTIISQNQYN